MKTQLVSFLAWSNWNDKTTTSSHFVSPFRKRSAIRALRPTPVVSRMTVKLMTSRKKFDFGNQELVSAFANN